MSGKHEQIHTCSPDYINDHFKHQWSDHTDCKTKVRAAQTASPKHVLSTRRPLNSKDIYICFESRDGDRHSRPAPVRRAGAATPTPGRADSEQGMSSGERGQHGTMTGSRRLDGRLCRVHAQQRRVRLQETGLTGPRGEGRTQQRVGDSDACLGHGRPGRQGIREHTLSPAAPSAPWLERTSQTTCPATAGCAFSSPRGTPTKTDHILSHETDFRIKNRNHVMSTLDYNELILVTSDRQTPEDPEHLKIKQRISK